jgi:hypothetical protein
VWPLTWARPAQTAFLARPKCVARAAPWARGGLLPWRL